MAKRGRKPMPTNLKVLTGVRSDRINVSEPTAAMGRPDCPAHLCDVARAEWDRMAGLLEEAGVLARTDGTALAIYCATYARWVRACEAIAGKPKVPTDEAGEPIEGWSAGDSMIDHTASGTPKVGAYVNIAAAAERDMARMLVEFGCTPSSRSRISIPNRKPTDPLAKFKAKA